MERKRKNPQGTHINSDTHTDIHRNLIQAHKQNQLIHKQNTHKVKKFAQTKHHDKTSKSTIELNLCWSSTAGPRDILLGFVWFLYTQWDPGGENQIFFCEHLSIADSFWVKNEDLCPLHFSGRDTRLVCVTVLLYLEGLVSLVLSIPTASNSFSVSLPQSSLSPEWFGENIPFRTECSNVSQSLQWWVSVFSLIY